MRIISIVVCGLVSEYNASEPYRYAEPDEYRLAPHDTLPYDWTRKDG